VQDQPSVELAAVRLPCSGGVCSFARSVERRRFRPAPGNPVQESCRNSHGARWHQPAEQRRAISRAREPRECRIPDGSVAVAATARFPSTALGPTCGGRSVTVAVFRAPISGVRSGAWNCWRVLLGRFRVCERWVGLVSMLDLGGADKC